MSVYCKKLLILMVATTIVFLLLCSCERSNVQNETTIPDSDYVEINFNYEEQSGYASNQFAVWIEDTNGNLIKTLYATHFTAKGGYEERSDAIPVWVAKSNLSSMKKTEVDALTSATPKAGSLSYYWDLKNMNGNLVQSGVYNFFVEGTLRWKNHVLYSGEIKVGDGVNSAQAVPKYTYAASEGQPALTSDSKENKMLSGVMASFVPDAN